MSRIDHYGPQLAELFATTEVPLTITEAAERIGSSKQRAYTWVEKNRGELVAIGRQKHGSSEYIGRQNPAYLNRTRRDEDAGEAVIEAGALLTVESVSVMGGRVILHVLDDRGGAARLQLVGAE